MWEEMSLKGCYFSTALTNSSQQFHVRNGSLFSAVGQVTETCLEKKDLLRFCK